MRDDVKARRDWLKELREKRGLTQRALAQDVGDGVSMRTVQDWESGARTPSRATQFALARVLGRKVLALFDHEAAELDGQERATA